MRELRFGDRGFLPLVRRFALFEIGFGDEALLKQLLAALEVFVVAIEIGFGAIERCLQRIDVVVTGLVSRLARRGIFLGGTQRGDLRLHIGCGLRFIDASQQLALLDVIALLDQNLCQLAGRIRRRC